MKLHILIYSLMCAAASLFLSLCHPITDVAPDPDIPDIPDVPDVPEPMEPVYSCSLIINNDMDFPISIYTNFDPQSGCLYGGELHRIIPAFSSIYIAKDRLLEETENPFDEQWKNLKLNSSQYAVLYILSVDPDTGGNGELLAKWKTTSSPFFKEESWTYTEHAGWYDETHPITYCEWTLSIAARLNGNRDPQE